MEIITLRKMSIDNFAVTSEEDLSRGIDAGELVRGFLSAIAELCWHLTFVGGMNKFEPVSTSVRISFCLVRKKPLAN